MLRTVQAKSGRATAGRFAIVASQYNARFVDAMVRAAKAELKRAGADSIQIIRVPGAYEIPVVAAELARANAVRSEAGARRTQPLAAIVCLGLVLRGETVHAAHIGEAVSQALMRIQVEHRVPVIHEVLLLENQDQARVRCLDRKHNRGTEAAQTAIQMARVMAGLP